MADDLPPPPDPLPRLAPASRLLDPTDGPPPAPAPRAPRKAHLTYAPPNGWATVNKAIRQHWRIRSAETAELRTFAWAEAQKAGAKLPHFQRVDVTVRHTYAGGILPDTDAPTLAVKALLDGLVDAMVIPDDSGAHVRSITYLAAELNKAWGNTLTLTLTEVMV